MMLDDGIDFSEKRFVEMDEVSTCTKSILNVASK